DGTVSKLDVELGERVVGTSQFQGTEMLRIAQLGQMELEVDVNENDVVNVVLGDSARIEIDAFPERTFRGIVTEIANSARVTGQGTQEQVTNFPVKIRILDVHNTHASGRSDIMASETPAAVAPNIRPGMSGTVDVYTHTVEDVVAVPIQAVTVRDVNKVARDRMIKERRGSASESESEADTLDASRFEGEDLRKVVFVVSDGKASMVEVQTGVSDDTHVHVESGLEGEETVIIGPYRVVSRTLEDGEEVTAKRDPLERAMAQGA
ncbi:MAG: efflux RND transporter periplasmic adaptor subunit, partial [Rhodothermales bacterium]|nr:efflux RND transporter periplasmic adaptor subunit [Rhodothermales bacterium]